MIKFACNAPQTLFWNFKWDFFFLQVFPDSSDEPVTLDEPSHQETTENADIEEDDDDGCQSAFDDNGIHKFQFYYKYISRPFSPMIIRMICTKFLTYMPIFNGTNKSWFCTCNLPWIWGQKVLLVIRSSCSNFQFVQVILFELAVLANTSSQWAGLAYEFYWQDSFENKLVIGNICSFCKEIIC